MSFPTAADLANFSGFPGLIPWLTKGAWKSNFKRNALAGAYECRVIAIQLAEDGPDFDVAEASCFVLIEAAVKVTALRAYKIKLFLFSKYDFRSRAMGIEMESECSCYQSDHCTHCVAVLEKLQGIAQMRPQPSIPQINPTFADWLIKIKKTGTTTEAPKPSPKPYNKFLAYCIEPYSKYTSLSEETLHLTLRVATQNKASVTIESSTAVADTSRPAKYMATEDLAICARHHQRNRAHRLREGMTPLEGGEWNEILLPALATGRMFFRKTDIKNIYDAQYTRLTQGPPLLLEASWEILSNGDAKPILKLPSPSILLIPTEPFHYLDLETHQLGHLQSHLPADLLRIWADGPTITHESIADLTDQLAKISPDHPLPLPAEKLAKLLTGLAPTPCLHISELTAGVFLKRFIGATLKFHYPGCPPLAPLGHGALARSVWIEDDTRMILERDAAAEASFASDLVSQGLIPLQSLLPSRDLNDKNRHSFVLGHLEATSVEWIEFLASPAYNLLTAAGWLIESDSKLGLTIHDINDFFPSIESDPDHGIDWFRFDVTGEFDGKRMSLIPHLARAIAQDWHLRYPTPDDIPETLLLPCDLPADGHVRFPAQRFFDILEQVRHLFHGMPQGNGPMRLDRLGAANVADSLAINSSETTRSLAALGRNLRDIHGLPPAEVPTTILAELRHYQIDGFRWLQFLANHGLHGILADDMGLGKTLQTLAHLAAQHAHSPGRPSLVVAPTSVVPNWSAETEKFAPHLKVLVLHGADRADHFERIPEVDIVLTSYPLLVRDFEKLAQRSWHTVVLDEAQYIKNPKALTAISACKLNAAHRICLSGTPMENHLGELWSLMRFLMPGFLSDEKTFNTFVRKPIERDRSPSAQTALNRRVSPLILRRTKDQVATELPPKTTIIHGIDLHSRQTDLYESVRAAMDKRIRTAITDKGLAKSHIIVLDALLKLRQICCHPQLLKSEAAQRCLNSAKLDYLTGELLPTLIEEGRRI
ncbi:MAG: hypothetical protein RLZZ282_889, partial [Verrucomicrobiota bacterium]